MIFLAADIHGELEIQRLLDDLQIYEIMKGSFEKEDYLIILGDVGLCWDDGKKDAWIREKLEALSLTTLWIDGNHENFDLIDELPVSEWHGGKVHFIGEKIIHLMRGYVYEIENKKFFAFGGGFSVDKMARVEGKSWWKREMPSEEEYQRGLHNLNKCGNQVDYIITHTAPEQITHKLVEQVISGEEELQDYLQKISEEVEFRHWFFGHWHMDCQMEEYTGVYQEVLRLDQNQGEVMENEISELVFF